MKVSFLTAMQGVVEYIEKNIYPTLTSMQEIVARTAVGVITEDPAQLKEKLKCNQIVQLLGIFDNDDMVDLEKICKHLKEQIARKGKLEISFKLMKLDFTFYPDDVDQLYNTIYKEYLTS